MGSLVYRARATASARARNQAYQFVQLFVEQVQGMTEHLRLPPLQLPQADSPIPAARLARKVLGIGPLVPVPHLINALERNGIVVFSLPFRIEKIDAFSTWTMVDGDRPIITLSSGCPGDRVRSSTAHELGHLVMHKGLEGNISNLENEANQFAAEFLLPEQTMRQVFRERLTLAYALHLKGIWSVSMQMLIRRARDLGCITERHYRYLFMQIGKRGWRKSEPGEVLVEKPRLYRQMAEMIYGSDNKSQLGVESGVSRRFADRLLANYDPAISNRKFLDTEPYYSGIRSHRN